MAEWLYEAGIGENRAILLTDNQIIEARIELPGLRAGTVADARLTSILSPRRRGLATLDDGTEILVEPLDATTEGGRMRIEIVREAIPEPGAVKRTKGRITDAPLCNGPDLAMQIGPHRTLGLHDADRFEAAGWSELLECAENGVMSFAGGTARITLTPAMTLIDIDGTLPPQTLALAGAAAAARAIRRMGIAGNIGIDLPTVAGKAERAAIAAIIDADLPPPFERTAVNGFGFVQIIRPRIRASLLEIIQNDPVAAAARALMRQCARSAIIGSSVITASAPIIAILHQNSEWIARLERLNGGAISLTIDPTCADRAGTISRIG